MRLRCISEVPNEAQARVLGATYRSGRQSFGLIEGAEYLVFGLRILGGQVWVDITDDARDSRYLFSAPLSLFEIVDDRVPPIWVGRATAEGQFRLAPPSMFAQYYFDDLFEQRSDVVEDFQKVRRKLEQWSGDGRV